MEVFEVQFEVDLRSGFAKWNLKRIDGRRGEKRIDSRRRREENQWEKRREENRWDGRREERRIDMRTGLRIRL